MYHVSCIILCRIHNTVFCVVPLEELCQQDYIPLCSVWHWIHIQPLHEETHEASSCGEFISVCSVWQLFHLLEQYTGTHKDSCLGTIHISVLCVTKNPSPETTHRDTIQVMLWIIHIHVLCVSRNSSHSTTQRDILTGIMGNSISLFCLISKKMACKIFFFISTTARNIQLL